MKQLGSWLKTEYKRAVCLLPSVLQKAAVLAVLAGMIAFCVQKWISSEGKSQIVQIGYVAGEDTLTQMAVSYVENMESVKNWCRLVPVKEAEGERMLTEGELTALIVLPEDVVEEILYGGNAPAQLYLSENAEAFGLMFEELAAAGISLLQTAQAEIYATRALTELFGEGSAALSDMYTEIDLFNLNIAMNREQFFRIRSLSVTGNQSFAVYYAGALLTLYLLLSGLFFGPYLKRSVPEQSMLSTRRGISFPLQLAGRMLPTMLLLFITLILPAAAWLFPGVRNMLHPALSWKGALLILLSLGCAAAILQFFYQLSYSAGTAVLIVGISTLFMGYVSGCLLPSALLPGSMNRLAYFLPTTYMKSAFSFIFSGDESRFVSTSVGLTVSMVCFFLAGCMVMKITEKRRSAS